ncbi:IS3 family transposase [Lactococcus lactis]|uniref:IS3 family transposase n=1 Tax=Lactococcus lactis TaxID=1358 RepID=UPI003864A072
MSTVIINLYIFEFICPLSIHHQVLEEAYQSIFWYIEAFYNSKRIHQSLGYLTPNQFEKVSA